MDQEGHSEECKGIRAAAAALLNDSVEGIAEEDVAESELASEKERKARKERHKAATEPSSSSAPPNKKLKDQHVKKEILKKMEEERVRKKREKNTPPPGPPPPPPPGPPPARSKRRRTSTCSSHESGVSLLTASLAATNRRCPGCRRVSCGTRAVCPGCRCVSCGTLACGCGPGCPLPGVDFADVCRRRVNEQGDDYAADIVLERGTCRALQTQQEDSDERAQRERAQDFADIVRERAQFVEDIVRDRKALQSQCEQDEAEEAEEAEVQAFLRSDAHDEADWAARPACDIDLEDENEDLEDLDEDFLRKARALQVKREQEQNEADRSSIADGAASSSIEQPPLPHEGLHCPIGAALRSTRAPLKAMNKMIAVQAKRGPWQPVPKKVGAAMGVQKKCLEPSIAKHKALPSSSSSSIRCEQEQGEADMPPPPPSEPPSDDDPDRIALKKRKRKRKSKRSDDAMPIIPPSAPVLPRPRPSLQARPSQQALVTGEALPPPEKTSGESTAIIKEEEEEEGIAQEGDRAAKKRPSIDVVDDDDDPIAALAVGDRRFSIEEALANVEKWTAVVRDIQQNPGAHKAQALRRAMEKLQRWSAWAAGNRPQNVDIRNAHRQRNRDKKPKPKVVPPPPKIAKVVSPAKPKPKVAKPKIVPPAKGIAPPAKVAKGIAPLGTKARSIARVPPRPPPPPKSIGPRPPIHPPPPKSIGPRPPIHIPFAYKGADPAPSVQQFLKACDEHMPLEQAGSSIEGGRIIRACGHCGKIRQYPQWVTTRYCSEACRIDGEASAAQVEAEGQALG